MAKQEFIPIDCPICKRPFGMLKDFYDICKSNANTTFYCPRGHDLHFPEQPKPHVEAKIISLEAYKEQVGRKK